MTRFNGFERLPKIFSPGSANRIEKSDGRGNVDTAPLWYADLRDEDRRWDDEAVERKGYNMRNDLAYQEKVVDDMDLLPDRHFLHHRQ